MLDNAKIARFAICICFDLVGKHRVPRDSLHIASNMVSLPCSTYPNVQIAKHRSVTRPTLGDRTEDISPRICLAVQTRARWPETNLRPSSRARVRTHARRSAREAQRRRK